MGEATAGRALSLTLALAFALALGSTGCLRAVPGPAPAEAEPARVRVYEAAAPSAEEPWCAWFGDARGDTLYFGIAAFWGTFRNAGGDPEADLRIPGPRWIGRFDLAGERFLAPLPVGPMDAPGGVWDVLAHPDGSVWFTTFFGRAGRIPPAAGQGAGELEPQVAWLEEAGPALNELALGPEGRLLVSRYASAPDGTGEVLLLAPDGSLEASLPLAAPPGLSVAAKSVAWDPLRREVWVNTDLLDAEGEPAGHDARVLDLEGRERLRFAAPELQFVAFGPDGTGWFAERDGPRLRLRIRRPEHVPGGPHPLPTGVLVPLDDAYPALDFVQEIRPGPAGAAWVTRWSGLLHRVGPEGDVRDLALPRSDRALYYTAVPHRDRVCATRCGDVEVVCRDAPG